MATARFPRNINIILTEQGGTLSMVIEKPGEKMARLLWKKNMWMASSMVNTAPGLKKEK